MGVNRRGWKVLSSVASIDGLYCVDVYLKDDSYGYALFRNDPEDGGAWTLLPGHGQAGFSNATQAGRNALANVPWLRGQVSKVARSAELWITELAESGSTSDSAVHNSIVRHYGQDRPIDRIKDQLRVAGFDLANLEPHDLAGVDEFHLGGRLATLEILKSVDLNSESRVLDVGCGIGGVARTIATVAGCHVSGVDLTPAFVETARELSDLVGMSAATSFDTADATSLLFEDDLFDAVTLFHVGMNVEDKVKLFTELGRVVRSQGTIHVYDIMQVGDGEITFPVPWSSTPASSFVRTPADYVDALTEAGLSASAPLNRLDLVRTALAGAKANPPPLNLSHLMGSEWPTMFGNLSAALAAGILAPVEILARPQV